MKIKLNHECVRDVLLFVEENIDVGYAAASQNIKIGEYSTDDINYACLKLYEGGFLNGQPQPKNIAMHTWIIIYGLTWNGHEFLGNIREEKSWQKTKKIVDKIGSVSLNILSSTASKVILGLINQELAKAGLL